jgi:hypothetical protein
MMGLFRLHCDGRLKRPQGIVVAVKVQQAQAMKLKRIGAAWRSAERLFDLEERRLRTPKIKKCAGPHELELAKIFSPRYMGTARSTKGSTARTAGRTATRAVPRPAAASTTTLAALATVFSAFGRTHGKQHITTDDD